ncbi:MAG: 2-oxoacid:ferredoxin oxidoreductase subunit beta [Chloroflexota bacterium]|nr:2-oxoacid:ferredoxin oxidoreductase subunit beta [Chloroflexota bacterium]
MGALVRAIDSNGYSKDDIALISGIGCSGRISTYLDFNTLHTTHGRALTFATGLKMAKPSLKVIVVMGDGDAAAIGGNHLIHAARRNVDITAIIVNNQIYGMTGGQASPTTPLGLATNSTSYGNLEPPFDISRLVEAAGAVFVGRSTVYHTRLLEQIISKALNKSGFSVVEVISQCVTHFGKLTHMNSAVEMMKWQKSHAITAEKASELEKEKLEGKIVIGVLVDREAPTFHEEYEKLRARIRTKRQ